MATSADKLNSQTSQLCADGFKFDDGAVIRMARRIDPSITVKFNYDEAEIVFSDGSVTRLSADPMEG